MQGKVADFGIPDIFQLISSQGKSGALRIRGDDREIVFLFSDGQIVDVQPEKGRPPEGMLGKMLVDAGYLSDPELRRILATQGRSPRKIGEILVEDKKLSPETLARYLYLQVKEMLFFSLRIKEGDYRFEGFAVRPPAWMKFPIRADVLMMEGMQFLDEYPLYRGKFPPGRFLVARQPGVKADFTALSEEERNLWKVIDFSPDPWRVCRRACVTWFEGIKALSLLLDRGYIKVVAAADEAADAFRRIRVEMGRRRRIGRVRVASWVVALALAGWWIGNGLLSASATRAFSSWIRFF
ncbi:MAG: DUF4388 domain-containing protein [Deltaproteobacteria bacterium]|nr:DUF4388 domain-containing protein [Deltaproteobacteria bacterium]